MRITLVINGLGYGGAERLVEADALDLAAAGHAVQVLCTTRGGPLVEPLRRAGIDVEILGIAGPLDLRTPARLARAARRFRPDLLHSHLAVSDIALTAASPALGGPRVTTLHNPGVQIHGLKPRLWHLVLPRFHHRFVVSAAVGDALGVPGEPLRPSAVRLTDLPLDRAQARRRLGLPARGLLVLAVGRDDPIKGFDLLPRVAARLRTPDVVFARIGEAAALEGVVSLGPRGDVPEVVAAADVVICPSRSEGFPQVPLHAMWAGVPVVATRVGGLPEVVADDETGLLAPRDDVGALARALDALLQDPARAHALGAAGRARVLSEGLTREGTMARLLTAYARLLGES